MRKRHISDISKIVIHCSASEWGDAEEIRKWHLERGWDDNGYNFVILNGYGKYKASYDEDLDGKVEIGRDITYVPSHCYGHNKESIGICVVGNWKFTSEQILTSLPFLINELREKYGISKDDVYCHYQFSESKTCPNIPIERIKALL